MSVRAQRALRRLAIFSACASLFGPAALHARRRAPDAEARRKRESMDPSRWFATRTGLIRVYQERAKGTASGQGKQPKAPPAEDAAPPAGASCEVVESTPRDGETPARTRESCTLIASRKARPPAALTYELRQSGIFMVRAETAGQQPTTLERLLLPLVKKGKSWSEKRGKLTLSRTVKSAGRGCRAAGRSFGDCLVLKVVERDGKKLRRTYAETYAAGVGLVEDAQWELIDVKGL